MKSVNGELCLDYEEEAECYADRFDACKEFFEQKINTDYVGLTSTWHIVLSGWSLGGTLAEVLTIQNIGIIDHCESFNAVNDKPDHLTDQKKSTFETNVEKIYERLYDEEQLAKFKKNGNKPDVVQKNLWDAKDKIFSHHIKGDTLSEGTNVYKNQIKDNIDWCYEHDKEARTKTILHSDFNFLDLVGVEADRQVHVDKEINQLLEKERK